MKRRIFVVFWVCTAVLLASLAAAGVHVNAGVGIVLGVAAPAVAKLSRLVL